eukprot:10059745-Ditylum_brightwellii.AAC.1
MWWQCCRSHCGNAPGAACRGLETGVGRWVVGGFEAGCDMVWETVSPDKGGAVGCQEGTTNA